MAEFHLRDTPQSSVPRVKPPPQSSKIPTPFSYIPSDDGTDENLLILLHGLGDTHLPFAKLGRQLKLPQTAVLALRAPEQVPFLYEDAFQWYTSFDDLGELIQRPNPTPALHLLSKVIQHLTTDTHWPLDRIHLFGFAQGGSVAVEFGIHMWKQELQNTRRLAQAVGGNRAAGAEGTTPSDKPEPSPSFLASIVTVGGPLLSYHTPSTPCPTPILAASRGEPSDLSLSAAVIRDFNKAFRFVRSVTFAGSTGGMPASKVEWEPIMRFWSDYLSRRRLEGLYEVVSGSSS